MKLKFILPAIFICCKMILPAQEKGPQVPGRRWDNGDSKTGSGLSVMNGNSLIATSYTMQACGLNYTQASLRLNQRTFNNVTPVLGTAQPATFSISGIPPCATILKAFLYVCSVSAANATVSASITNPVNTSSVFPMTIIGTDVVVCWLYDNTISYRADVTSIISGNGNYIISGIPVYPSPSDPEGATLFIVYADPTEAYTGNIVIADGCQSAAGSPVSSTISAFNVCGTPTLTSHFMLVGDLQSFGDSYLNLNTSLPNFTVTAANCDVWNFLTATVSPVFNGQSSAKYGIDPSMGGDCVAMVMAGMYYRNACLTCSGTGSNPPLLTVNVTSSCPATATALASGGNTSYNFSWPGTAQTGSVVSGLATGIYTVIATEINGCNIGTSVVFVNAIAPSISINSLQTICKGNSVTLVAGPASSYTWSPTAFLNAVNLASVAASPTASTIYTVAYTNSLGCTGSRTTQVVVVPTQTFSASNLTVCAGTTMSLTTGLTGIAYSWTGPGSFSSLLQNPLRVNATSTMSGVYGASVTTAGGCINTATLSATVLGAPSPTFASNSPLCAGSTLSVTSYSSGLSYNWSGPGGFTGAAQNFSIANTATTTSGVYSLSTTFSTGCVFVSTLSIVVLPNPTLAIITISNSCENSIRNLQASGANSYLWTGPNGFTSTAQNATVVTLYANSGIYQVVGTSTNGCQASLSLSLGVLPLPVISVNGATVCYNSPANLTATGPAFFSWVGPNSFSSTTQNIFIPFSNTLTVGAYTLTAFSTLNSCSISAIANLSAMPVPTVTSSNVTVCYGQPATISATGAQTYSWNGPNSYTSNAAVSLVPTADNLSVGVYTVVGTAVNACTNSAVMTLTTLPLPLLAATSTVVCFNAPSTIQVTGAQSYSWTGPNNFSSNSQNVNFQNTNLLNSGSYTVVGTANNLCSATAVVSLSTIPLPQIFASGTVVCAGQPAILQAVGAINYLWIGPGITATGATLNISSTNSLTAGVYTVLGTGANTCSNSATATLVAIPLPSLAVIGTTVCTGQPALFSVSGAQTYIWAGPTFSAIGAYAFIPVTNYLSAGVYSVWGTATNSCTDIATFNFSPLALPIVSVSSATVCFNQPVQLNATGAQSYLWTGSAGIVSNTSSLYVSAANNVLPETYTITGTGVNLCSSSVTAILNTLPLPVVTLSSDQKSICSGESVMLTAGGNATIYSWMPAGLPPYSTLVVTPLINTSYTVQGTGFNGCVNTASIVLFVSPCTGIKDFNGTVVSIAVYPNPNNGNFTITSPVAVLLILVNSLGQSIRNLKLYEENNFSAIVSDLTEGVYYLVSRGQSATRKIIVKK